MGKRTSRALYNRLSKHAESIAAVHNLALGDFYCRWLVLDPIWIGLTEQVLIATYQPIWNAVVDGFGNNDPGKGRWNQKQSQWDTLHPGRPWACNLQKPTETVEDIVSRIKNNKTK